MSNFELVLTLFLQLAVILGGCRLCIRLGTRYLGQTPVVCEMIAGVLLGPSLFGLLAPVWQQWLFPKLPVTLASGQTIPNPSMSILFAVSQLGLVIYMFLVGLELNTGLIRRQMRGAAVVSGAGIAVPFVLGGSIAFWIVGDRQLFGEHVTGWMAAVYLGASMSITAFPMLARMLYERGIARTSFGTLALAAGSMDDALAWCLLAVVLAGIHSSIQIALLAIGGGVLYAIGISTVGRRLFSGFACRAQDRGGLSTETLALVLLVVMLCAWFTDAIGIYAVFGAFLAGTAMPRGEFAEQVQRKTAYLTSTLLLPIFFVYSGLNTRLDLVNTPALWLVTALIVAVAVAGKWGACMLAARAVGIPWREATTIGVLMNARGLMELIILNIGLEHGIITPTLFTMMVIMAIVTTLMTSPLFHLVYARTAVASSTKERSMRPAYTGGVD